VTISYSVSTIR